jgi:hypothetical protein
MEQIVQNNAAVRTQTVRSEEQILKLLEEFDTSGFSVKDFCEVSDINEATFYSWQKRYRLKPDGEAKSLPAGQSGFTTIEVLPSASETKPTLFAEVGSIKLYREVSAEYLKSLLP